MNDEWNTPAIAPEAERITLWDGMAAQYTNYESPTRDNDPLIRLIEDRNILDENTRVLDLGCAAGKYSFYFAEHSHSVVGIDLSPQMVQFANNTKQTFHFDNVSFIRADWSTLKIDTIGGRHSFDFIFANMTPAITTSSDLTKLIEVCRGSCLLGSPAGRKSEINDQVLHALGLPDHQQVNTKLVAYEFSQLWETGLLPEVTYFTSTKSWKMSLEEAVPYYFRLAEARMNGHLSPSQKTKILDLLHSLQNENEIQERVESCTAVLYFRK